jgi:hypothetical protein
VGLAFGVVLTLGATTSPDELTVRRLTVVDARGKTRFAVATASDGTATLALLDPNGEGRFLVTTNSEGATDLALTDANEKVIWSPPMP